MTTIANTAWGLYASLQDRIRRSTRSCSAAYGLEAAMDALLDLIEGSVSVPEPDIPEFILRIARTAARRHRSQLAQLRKSYDGKARQKVAPDASDLRRVLGRMKQADARLLMDSVCGYTDQELSRRHQITPGAARTRVCRLKGHLRA